MMPGLSGLWPLRYPTRHSWVPCTPTDAPRSPLRLDGKVIALSEHEGVPTALVRFTGIDWDTQARIEAFARRDWDTA
jgi:hypothetical protein